MAEIITYTQAFPEAIANVGVTAAVYSMLSKYDDRFSYTPGTNVIDVDNAFSISCTGGWRNNNMRTVTFHTHPFQDTSTTLYSVYCYFYPASFQVKLIKTEELYYLEFSYGSGVWGGVICLMNISNTYYFGVTALGNDSGGNKSAAIETATFVCPETGDITYAVRKIADYTLNITDLFFTPISVISNSSGEFVVPSDFYSCSNVTYRNTVSTNNKNYFAVGTNTLIELTEPD